MPTIITIAIAAIAIDSVAGVSENAFGLAKVVASPGAVGAPGGAPDPGGPAGTAQDAAGGA
jgi:hypothetical protein